MTSLTTPIILIGWAFVPGPNLMEEPTDSQIIQEISEHSAASVAATLLAFPGTQVIHPAEPSWWQWTAEWRSDERSIGLGMTLMNDEESQTMWGGSMIDANCLAGDIIEIWTVLQARHAGVWLHADCIMHTQQSFLEAVTMETEQSATYRREGRNLIRRNSGLSIKGKM